MIQISDDLQIGEDEIELSFVRAGGPGGQHVNKASTAVQLRFDAAGSPSLPDEVKERLRRLAGSRMSVEGVVTIEASRFRSQMRNREDALERLLALLREAAAKPKARKPTKPGPEADTKRLEEKRRRSDVKKKRKPVRDEEL